MKGLLISARKLLLTLINFKKTAYHHYGKSPSSLIRFIYYSVFRLNTFIVYENDLQRELPTPDLEQDCCITIPSLGILKKLRTSMDLPREFYCDQIYGLKKCFMVSKQEVPAYVQWLIFKGEYSRFLLFSEDVVEFNYIVTLPNFRGKSLCTEMLKYSSICLKEEGYKKTVAVIHNDNTQSIRAFEKAGFCRTSQIKAFGPFNFKVKIDCS